MGGGLATLNGIPVIGGCLMMPKLGMWAADLSLDTAVVPTGPQTLVILNENGSTAMSLAGAIVQGGAQSQVVTARLVAGAGGMGSQQAIPERFYVAPTLKLPLQDILGSVGEKLSPTVSPNILGIALPSWSRISQKAATAFQVLLNQIPGNPSWRILPDGTMWIGFETWPDSGLTLQDDTTAQLLRDDEHMALFSLGVSAPTLLPGMSLLTRHVSYVQHEFDSSKIRSSVYFEKVSEQSDRLKAPFVGIVQALTGKYDYSGVFAGRVSKQNPTTYAVDVVLDSQSLPDPVNVDIRGAAPGMRVKVAPGTRVGIVYDNQDPSKPKATLFEADPGLILAPPAPTQTIEVDLFATTAVKLGSASCLPLVQAPAYLAAEETALGSAAGVGLVFADLSALATALTSLVVALEAVSAIAAPPLTAALEGLRDVCTQLTKDLTTATTNLNAFTGGQAGFQTKITEAS